MQSQMRPPQAGQSCIRGPIALTALCTCPSRPDVDTHFLGVRATAEQTLGTREWDMVRCLPSWIPLCVWGGCRAGRERWMGDIPPSVNSPGQLAPQPRSHNLSKMLCIFITESSPPLVQTRLQRVCQKILFKYQSSWQKNQLSTLSCPSQKHARHAPALCSWETAHKLGSKEGDLRLLNCSPGVLGLAGAAPLLSIKRCSCREAARRTCS